MEPACSLPYPQEFATRPYPDRYDSIYTLTSFS